MQAHRYSGLIGGADPVDLSAFVADVVSYLYANLGTSVTYADVVAWMSTVNLHEMQDVYAAMNNEDPSVSARVQSCTSLPQQYDASCWASMRSEAAKWCAEHYVAWTKEHGDKCKTCADVGAQCGDVKDGCGGTLDCGQCQLPSACTNGQCVNPNCNPKTCAQLATECGKAPTGCGDVIDCGSCDPNHTCVAGKCVVPAGPHLNEPIRKPGKAPDNQDRSGLQNTNPTNGQQTSSAWPWILGIGAVAALGGAAIYYSKHKSPSSNPSKTSGYKNLNAAIKHAYQLAVVEERDIYVYPRSDGFHLDTATPRSGDNEEYIRVTPDGSAEKWVRGRVGWNMQHRARVH